MNTCIWRWMMDTFYNDDEKTLTTKIWFYMRVLRICDQREASRDNLYLNHKEVVEMFEKEKTWGKRYCSMIVTAHIEIEWEGTYLMILCKWMRNMTDQIYWREEHRLELKRMRSGSLSWMPTSWRTCHIKRNVINVFRVERITVTESLKPLSHTNGDSKINVNYGELEWDSICLRFQKIMIQVSFNK